MSKCIHCPLHMTILARWTNVQKFILCMKNKFLWILLIFLFVVFVQLVLLNLHLEIRENENSWRYFMYLNETVDMLAQNRKHALYKIRMVSRTF